MALDPNTKEDLRVRFLQICRQYFVGNTFKEMSTKIGENDKIINAICNGSRELGISTIVRLSLSTPAIDINWLLSGRGNMIQSTQSDARTSDANSMMTVQMLRDILREKDRQIAELTADNALLKNELRTMLYEKEKATTVDSSEQHTSTETEIYAT